MTNTPPPVIVAGAGEATASVIWLHGLGADGHDFEPIVAELDLPSNHGIRFVFPHAPVRPITINRGMAMRGWYDVAENDLTRREDEAGIRDSARILSEHIAGQRALAIDHRRIVLAGFSQGGAVALFAGLRHHEPLAGILALSTYLPLPMTLPVEANPANVSVPIFMAHGSFDPIIPAQQGDASARLLKASGYNVEWRSYPMPHSVCEQEVADISRWLRQRLPA